jgi:hypothetical protein
MTLEKTIRAIAQKILSGVPVLFGELECLLELTQDRQARRSIEDAIASFRKETWATEDRHNCAECLLDAADCLIPFEDSPELDEPTNVVLLRLPQNQQLVDCPA